MEKESKFRVVGNIPEKIKEEKKEEIRARLFEKHLTDISEEEKKHLERVEYPKTETERALITRANEETSMLREEAGLEPYDIPERNFHIVPTSDYQKVGGKDSDAVTLYQKQAIVFDAGSMRGNHVKFGSIAFHEALHLKAHFTLEVEQGEKGNLVETPYREGVGIRAPQKRGLRGKEYFSRFHGLHEAIVSDQQMAYNSRLLVDPMLAEERAWLASPEAEEITKHFAKEKNIPEQDIYWVAKDGKGYEMLSYRFQRRVFDLLAKEIAEAKPDAYNSAEAVKKEFLNAHFTGRLLPIAHLVEKVFGKGSFRILGAMGTDKESAINIYDILRKARMRVKAGDQSQS